MTHEATGIADVTGEIARIVAERVVGSKSSEFLVQYNSRKAARGSSFPRWRSKLAPKSGEKGRVDLCLVGAPRSRCMYIDDKG